MDVRIFNTNTDRIVVETMQLDEAGSFLEIGNYAMPGVPSPGSEVKCAFLHPSGTLKYDREAVPHWPAATNLAHIARIPSCCQERHRLTCV